MDHTAENKANPLPSGLTGGPEFWTDQEEGRLTALIAAGNLTSQTTLPFFQDSRIEVESKADASPVTIADRTAESEFRKWILEHFPDDGILGEEQGTHPGTSPYRWVVDPIDGTKSFIAGVPLYSTLVALEKEGTPIAGGIWIPALGEMAVAAVGRGCWYRRGPYEPWQPSGVSPRQQLEEAIFVTTAVDSFDQVHAAANYQAIESRVRFTRTWGDGYGYLLIATGRADVMVDPIVNPWDVAAILPVIAESGGTFTDWSGQATTKSTNAVATNGHLHAKILEFLSSAGSPPT